MRRVRPFLLGQRVAQPDVAERAAHHHLVVAAARAVAVELERRDAVLLQPLAGRAPGGIDPAGEMWSVVTESPSTASTRAPVMSVDRRGLALDAVEERRPRDVGRGVVPAVAAAADGHGQGAPALVAVEHLAVDAPEDVGRDGRWRSCRLDLLGRRPDVGQEDRLAVAARAERLGRAGRSRPCRRARTPPRAAARRGSWRAPADGCGPRSCGCRTGRRRRRGRCSRSRWRPPRRADRCCRCTSCSRSRRRRSRASRAARAGRRTV